MIKNLFCSVLVAGGLAVCAHAKPMDARAAENIPELRQIVMSIRNGSALSPKKRVFIAQCIDSKDPVLLSASAWIIGDEKGEDEALSDKLKSVQQGKLDDMSLAFIRIALEKREARRRDQQWVPSKELQEDSNPYLHIETTRALLKQKGEEGMAALKRMQADKRPLMKAAAERLSMDVATNAAGSHVPMFDERYELLLSIIQGD